ncbi:MAG: LacI family DNA-binding transcriptional regulator, partial [Lachnospiraceae bacterium]|nr:LacI family DNA-binding transcriptional regulator [Lachnospiraceae bacterium]
MANLTIKDIAKLCGVGTSTVSRAMNDDPGINSETKERILKVVKEFHYVPNNSARNLKVNETNTVGVLVKGRNNSFFQGMYTFIEQELQKIGYDFILKEISYDDNNTMQAVEMVKEQRLKGLIFLGGMIEDLDKIRQHIDIPYVFCTVAVDYNATDCNLVAIDDEKESYRIVDYLIK